MCSHCAFVQNDDGKVSMFKINLSYFPSRAQLLGGFSKNLILKAT